MYNYLIGAESNVEYYRINELSYKPVRLYSLVIQVAGPVIKNSQGNWVAFDAENRIFQVKKTFGMRKNGVFCEAETRFEEVEDEGRIYKIGKYFLNNKEIRYDDLVECFLINDISLVRTIARFPSPYVSLEKYLCSYRFRKMDKENPVAKVIISEIEGKK